MIRISFVKDILKFMSSFNVYDILVAGEKMHTSIHVIACHIVMVAKLIKYESCKDYIIFVTTI